MKKQITIMLGMLLLLASCHKNEVSFTYSPAEPRAGEAIHFVNGTEEGEEWSWNFGDGTTSTSKSPTKTYKKPGIYTVILKVDDKATRTHSQTITVHDTVPAIGVSDSIVYYYRKVTLSADVYNPFGHKVAYEWALPESAHLINGELDKKAIDVYFSQLGTQQVECTLNIGDETYPLKAMIEVKDTTARALVMAADGMLLHQRIYEYGYESALPYPVEGKAITNPTALVADLNTDGIYIFNDDNTAAGMLAYYNIANGATEIVAQNAAAGAGQGFHHGSLRNGILYWTAGDCAYKIGADKRNVQFTAGAASAQLLASASALGLGAGQEGAGIICYNGTMLYAYAAGVHRFAESQTAASSILGDYTVTAMALDAVSQKLYFTTAEGLYVANLNGEYAVLLDASANGKSLCVDNDDNRLFFTTAEGVKEMPLVHSNNNSTQETAQAVNTLGGVTALTVDLAKR